VSERLVNRKPKLDKNIILVTYFSVGVTHRIDAAAGAGWNTVGSAG
jgi:hypothetical protein